MLGLKKVNCSLCLTKPNIQVCKICWRNCQRQKLKKVRGKSKFGPPPCKIHKRDVKVLYKMALIPWMSYPTIKLVIEYI